MGGVANTFGRKVEIVLFINRLLPRFSEFRQVRAWAKRGFSMPAPWRVKMNVLDRYKLRDAAWVESGTFIGQTAQHLALSSERVITLEPSPELFAIAQKRLHPFRNVKILNSTSERGLSDALAQAGNNRVCFWLDGHFSDGVTFWGGGLTPIREELAVIADWLNGNSHRRAAVFIDDVRLFSLGQPEQAMISEREAYPALAFLTEWATSNGMSWLIEHDIFVARPAIL